MATNRNQRVIDQVVLDQDTVTLNRDSQAVCAPGSFYLPSASGLMLLLSRKRGKSHEMPRHPGHARTPLPELAWSGTLGIRLRDRSVITIN
jgi:hypothetical protein